MTPQQHELREALLAGELTSEQTAELVAMVKGQNPEPGLFTISYADGEMVDISGEGGFSVFLTHDEAQRAADEEEHACDDGSAVTVTGWVVSGWQPLPPPPGEAAVKSLHQMIADRGKCRNCGADYDPKWIGTTCSACDGIIQQPDPPDALANIHETNGNSKNADAIRYALAEIARLREDKARLDKVRDLIVDADSMLSLLVYRSRMSTNWEVVGGFHEAEDLVTKLRRTTKELDAARGDGAK